MKVLVYLPEEKLCPKGGPLSVGYYYHEEMKRRGEHTLDFTHVNVQYEETHRKGRSITSKLPKWFNNARLRVAPMPSISSSTDAVTVLARTVR